MCTKSKILTFKEYWKLFVERKLPKEVEDWIYSHKDDNQDSGDSEIREQALLYQMYSKSKEKEEKELDKTIETEDIVKTQKIDVQTNICNIRNKLKDDITKLLQEFENNTGLTIENLYLSRIENNDDIHKDNVYVKTITMK